jgi:hypothetical protein
MNESMKIPQPPRSIQGYLCIICGQGVTSGEDTLKLDPCAVVLTSNANKEKDHRKAQTFFCHFECFKKVIHDENYLYITESATLAEIHEERKSIQNQLESVLYHLVNAQEYHSVLTELLNQPKGKWNELKSFTNDEALLNKITPLEELCRDSLLVMWFEDFYERRWSKQTKGPVVMISLSNYFYTSSTNVYKLT